MNPPKSAPSRPLTVSSFDATSLGFFLIFHLSTKCNLECSYCNVEAGPHGLRPVLDPHVFEKWLIAFASLGPSQIGIQLHGGEPLLVNPSVELFAAIARNTLARFPDTKLVDMTIQSNGVLLDDARLDSLEDAGLRVNISIDGPAAIHDRQRPMAAGRGSHADAMRAHHRLRARGKNTAVISVVTDPEDVIPSLEFFQENGFREARMNPMRPEGRAARMRDWDDAAFMQNMALQYFEAARRISDYNRRNPQDPFIEDNLSTFMKLLTNDSADTGAFRWTS